MEPDVIITLKWFRNNTLDVRANIPDKNFVSELLKIAYTNLSNDKQKIIVATPQAMMNG